MSTSIPATDKATRRPLSRRRVLEAGLAYLDRHGLDELSMRHLAAELGVEAMSLYKHVANKDDLLYGIYELVWEEIAAAAPPSDDWLAWLRSFGYAIRDAIHRHPQALPVIVVRRVTPVAGLELFDAQLQRCRDLVCSRADGIAALRVVAAFAIGSGAADLTCFGPPAPEAAETDVQRIRRIARALPPDTPDHLVDVAVAVCGECDSDEMFTTGLEFTIRGFASMTESKQPQ